LLDESAAPDRNVISVLQVEVGEGFEALGAVLWTALGHCQAENDVHNASVIMMLSQVRLAAPHCLCTSEHGVYWDALSGRCYEGSTNLQFDQQIALYFDSPQCSLAA
jgi:hypothetical protein